MITESFRVKGNLNIKHFDEKQTLKEERDLKNLVVATGKNYIVSRMESNSSPIMSHMAVGTANVAASTGQTLLLGETARVAFDSDNIVNNTITYVSTFGAGTATGTLAEAGIFNSGNTTANTGTMLCRVRFNEINKGASDVVVITWNVTVE